MVINMYNKLINDINNIIENCINNNFYFNKIERRLYIIEMYKNVILFLRRIKKLSSEETYYLINKLNDFIEYNKPYK